MAASGRNRGAFALGAILLLALVAAASAGGETFGQLEVWGAAGTGAGQFNNPAPCAVFGVDPVDGSVYVGDSAPGKAGYCRIQKLSAKGEFKGATTIQVQSGSTTVHPLRGIAVDHARERFYLVEDDENFVGSDVLAYSTVPNGSQELLQSGAPLPLPGGAEALKQPEGLAVDPADGDIVIIGLNSTGEHVVIERFSNAGAVEARFDEVGNPLHKIGRVAKSVAVGKEGKTYTVAGLSSEEGKKATRAWELPADLSELKEVPGFKKAAESEAWPSGLMNEPYGHAVGGTQIAISPDGKTLYFKESGGELSSPTSPGSVLVRGYSLSEEKTTVIYGGGQYEEGKGACAIGTSGSPIGATGEKVVVFDHANEEGESEGTYGPPRVVTFGPKGKGCAPAARFTVSPKGEEAKGGLVTFNAEESDLNGNSLTSLEWDFGDGTVETVEAGEEEPEETITHRYLTPGEYTVKLKLELSNPEVNPPAFEETVTVVPGSPVPIFEASPFEVAPGGTVEFDASLSYDPVGGACDQLNGCAPSFEMQSYEWDFGDGSQTETSAEPTISHAFANPGTAPIERSVTLTVTTNEGVSGSLAETITVQGIPSNEGGGGGGEPLPPSGNAPPPPPGGAPPGGEKATGGPTVAQKRALARQKCKKLKGKGKVKCMKKANSIGKKKGRVGG